MTAMTDSRALAALDEAIRITDRKTDWMESLKAARAHIAARLREPAGVGAALRIAHRHLDMAAMRISHCKDAAAIEAALAAPQPPAEAQAQGGGEACPHCKGNPGLDCNSFGRTAPPSAPVGVAFNRCPDDGSLVSKQGYRLAYGGVPGCWRVKPEDFPAEALAQQPVVVVDDSVLEHAIDESDGDWHDGEFFIDGPALMNLLRSVAQQPAAVDEVAREDAERYRWLRSLDGSYNAAACVNINIGFDWIEQHGADLDAAIDQARGK